MTTSEEIQRRVEEADTARSAKRTAAAKLIGELAQRRATIAEQLGDIDRELGVALAAASDVIGVDELAEFTDVPAADLTRWLAGHKTVRPRRKRSAPDANRVSSTPKPEPAPPGLHVVAQPT